VTALHAGAPLTLFGRATDGPVTVTATGPDGRPCRRGAGRGGHDAIGSVWARARVRDLEDRYAVTADLTLCVLITPPPPAAPHRRARRPRRWSASAAAEHVPAVGASTAARRPPGRPVDDDVSSATTR